MRETIGKVLGGLCTLFLVSALPGHCQSFDEFKTVPRAEGFFDFYAPPGRDNIYLVVDELEKEFLYVHSLSWGVGQNDLSLDRGQLGGEAVVLFRKAGDRILMIQTNLDFRASTTNAPERKAVEQAFARSVLFGFPICDQSEGRYLVDLSPLLFSDAHHVAERLAGTGQGIYTLDRDRSMLEPERTRSFPDNVEFEALITLTGKPEGNLIIQVTPDARHVSVVQHHSFVRLPDEEYTPRAYHPGSGCNFISYLDFATPVSEPIRKLRITRHRLDKNEPIVYYLDNGTPEPVRSALLEGGNWWEEAFESIGFQGAFRVEMLPEDADPMDVRYNTIQWVHRSTRGWSYGNSVVDPRTGEIIKGHVSLGSLRIRQDFMIAQALMDRPYDGDEGNTRAMLDLALARIRQLAAHEIGHTLGFAHNFAASSNNRSSVMDYPHPMIRLKDGKISMDHAYDEGIGDWDKFIVAYAYSEFPETKDEEMELQKLLDGAHEKGLRYISDADARHPGGAHPYAHLWDNGQSATRELERILKIRSVAIKNFSLDNIRTGQSLSVLEDVFVPLYFYHRYQVEAASKLVGGAEYSYAVKGDADPGVRTLDADTQRAALEVLLRTLSPEVLAIPPDKLALFPPRSPGFPLNTESFEGRTGITFDYLAPVSSAADLTLSLLLYPARANRLVEQAAMDPDQLGLEEVVSSLIWSTFYQTGDGTGYEQEVRHTVNFITLDHLVRLAGDPEAIPQVKAIVESQLEYLIQWLEEQQFSGLNEVYKKAYLDQIEKREVRYLESLPVIPPGSPIGMECLSR